MVRTGLDGLIEERLDLLSGRRVGLVSHAAAVLPDLTGILDGLRSAGVQVGALFGAEHGFAGAALDGAGVSSGVDLRSGLPLFSLYGDSYEPTARMLSGLDALLVDFQDVGVRFYTFISTLYYVLRGAGKVGLPVFVLDRPNPLNGLQMEGPVLQPGFESFVGIAPLPVRHGLTFGEIAWLFNREYGLNAPLTVISMQGWRREMYFDDTGLPWVIPSPGMPHLSTALVYPGTCFIEGTNLSEGRGTALPFETAGAPWLDGAALADRLNHLKLPGVRFRAHAFRPTASKHAGQTCQGVQVHVPNRAAFQPLRSGLHLIAACRALAPEAFGFLPPHREGGICHFDLLAGNASLREQLLAGEPVDEILESWTAALGKFAALREGYLFY